MNVDDAERLQKWAIEGPEKPPKVVKWMSEVPTECQLCNRPLVGSFYDAASVYGPWAIMGRCCFMTHSYGLGQGKGQQYDLRTLEKIGG